MKLNVPTLASLVITLGGATFAHPQARPAADDRYISIGQVTSAFRPLLIASGDRLQKGGSEKMVAPGTIQFGPDGVAPRTPVQVTLQLPSQVRIDQNGSAIVYDGKNTPQKTPVDQRELDAVETLIEDSFEGFLRNTSTNASVRWLASGARDESAKGAPLFLDIVHASYAGKIRSATQQAKTYYFDSATKLLRRVEYIVRPGVNLQVDLSDWRDVQGTKVPFQIERRENNVVTLRLILSAAQLGPAADDSLFLGK